MVSTSFSKELLRHEKLAEAVKRFRCLYDKSLKDYKDKHKRNNAWTKVAGLTDMEQGQYLYNTIQMPRLFLYLIDQNLYNTNISLTCRFPVKNEILKIPKYSVQSIEHWF